MRLNAYMSVGSSCSADQDPPLLSPLSGPLTETTSLPVEAMAEHLPAVPGVGHGLPDSTQDSADVVTVYPHDGLRARSS